MNDFDVVIYDSVGVPFIGITPRHHALGGSELQIILVSESLAKLGKKVLVLNKTPHPAYQFGVFYYPIDILRYKKIKCKNLIINRYSVLNYSMKENQASLPQNFSLGFDFPKISFDNIFFFLQDFYDMNWIKYFEYIQSLHLNAKFITVSNVLNKSLPKTLNKKTIPNMIPDWVYEYKQIKNENKFVYCSAAIKGLTQTIQLWNEIKLNNIFKNVTLQIANPGYDSIDLSIKDNKNIEIIGNLSFENLVDTIAKSAGIFYVNIFPETFCIVAALANALKVKLHILCLNGTGALKETIKNSHFITEDKKIFMHDFTENYKFSIVDPVQNYKSSYLINEWKELLQYD